MNKGINIDNRSQIMTAVLILSYNHDMSGFREKTVEAVILKKQALGEADELVTIYAKESGKLRVVCKSSKLAKSKLQSQLQPVFLSQLTLVGNGPLPKVILATALSTHREIYESLAKMQLWYVASELVMRATADEETNISLYNLLVQFLKELGQNQDTHRELLILLSFKIKLLHAIGVSIQPPTDSEAENYFSNEHGGFLSGIKTVDGVAVSKMATALFEQLNNSDISALGNIAADSKELNGLITQYISYQLEREIRSEKFVSAEAS